MRKQVFAFLVFVSLLLGHSSVAKADDHSDLNVHWGLDGGITAGALAGALLMTMVSVDHDAPWDDELFGAFDEGVHQNFSQRAALLSDGLVAMTLVSPLLLQLNQPFDEAAGKRALVYGESLAVSLALNGIVKGTVQRPRPYTYNQDPRVVRYARAQGKDAQLSFYSGHASMSFTGAVAGSYLFARGSSNAKAKAAVWSLEMGMATATSLLRVRAGKHFYSDILVGAVVGTVVGVVVPVLHEQEAYMPAPSEWGAMLLGVGLGAAVGQLIPVNDAEAAKLVPMALEDGGGVSLLGRF